MAATVRQLFSSNRHSNEATSSHRTSSPWSKRERDTQQRGNPPRDSPQESEDDLPPPPPPKDAPQRLTHRRANTDSSTGSTPPAETPPVYRPGHLSRAGSVYSISRISFTSQISQLTAITLPDASILSKSISSIPTAEAAARALKDAASQIQVWIQKATDVLGGLDASDDAEWAAAAGSEGVTEVEQAVKRFESLVNVYITAVEDLQLRGDASSVPPGELREIVEQVEKVTASWSRIKTLVDDIKSQVEIALEWELFRDKTLGDISSEMEALNTSIFELEEKRYVSSAAVPVAPQDGQVDISELETMVNDSPLRVVNRLSQTHRSNAPESHTDSLQPVSIVAGAEDDTALLGLFARMQPLGASLDLLPQQLAKFKVRAETLFPSACQGLETGREELEARWVRLEADAESLRKELGEDKWNSVFRNASRRALKMIDSVERSLKKVDESLDNDIRLRHAPATLRKIEQYEAKKEHYCPAIDRVLNIVETGVKDRLTVNGEILRLRADLRQRWQSLQRDMKSLDVLLEEYATETGSSQQQLRDSVSTILSNTEQSVNSSSLMSPGSSPPSSVDLSRSNSFHDTPHTPQPYPQGKPRQASTTPSNTSAVATPPSKRFSSLPVPTRKTPVSRSSILDAMSGPLSSSPLSTPPSHSSRFAASKANTPADNRPRWSYASQGQDYDVTAYYRKLKSKGSHLHLSPSPRQSSTSSSPYASTKASQSRAVQSSSTPSRISSSRPSSRPPPLNRKRSDISSRTSTMTLSTPRNKPRSFSGVSSYSTAVSASHSRLPSTESGRGISMLPVPTSPATSNIASAGWESPVLGEAGVRSLSRRSSMGLKG